MKSLRYRLALRWWTLSVSDDFRKTGRRDRIDGNIGGKQLKVNPRTERVLVDFQRDFLAALFQQVRYGLNATTLETHLLG